MSYIFIIYSFEDGECNYVIYTLALVRKNPLQQIGQFHPYYLDLGYIMKV